VHIEKSEAVYSIQVGSCTYRSIECEWRVRCENPQASHHLVPHSLYIHVPRNTYAAFWPFVTSGEALYHGNGALYVVLVIEK
jgi:hypothetical protein